MVPLPKRRLHDSLNPLQIPSTTVQREPRKKALLIGITYKKVKGQQAQFVEGRPPSETSTESTVSELHGAYKDALAMKQLLIGTV